jgi:hypothetical protein
MSEHEHHGMKPLSGLAAYCRLGHHNRAREDRFGRMFPDFSPGFVPRSKLAALGAPGGPMDAGSQKLKTANVPVGMAFFGQFVDHDITLDTSTSFSQVVGDAGDIANVRSPTLDLDCIYGLGPEAQPYLYAQTAPYDGARLLTGADSGSGGLSDDDLLRSPNGRAMIGDPRNDENRIISQLQLAMIRFHNHVCDTLHAESGLEGDELYKAARRETKWHYQWNVVHDYLAEICGRPVVDRILGCGREYYCGGIAYIPVEFSVAAYRFGHSMIPMAVQTQKNGAKHDLFGTILGGGFKPLDDAKAVVDFHELFFTPENRSVERADKLLRACRRAAAASGRCRSCTPTAGTTDSLPCGRPCSCRGPSLKSAFFGGFLGIDLVGRIEAGLQDRLGERTQLRAGSGKLLQRRRVERVVTRHHDRVGQSGRVLDDCLVAVRQLVPLVQVDHVLQRRRRLPTSRDSSSTERPC